MSTAAKHRRRLQIIAVICLFIPLGTLTSFAVIGITSVKDIQLRKRMAEQVSLMREQVGFARDTLREAKRTASIVKATHDVITGKRSIGSVFHYANILGWETHHLVWDLRALYGEVKNADNIPHYYGYLLNDYEYVLRDYLEYEQKVRNMSRKEREREVKRLEVKELETNAAILAQTTKISENLANETRVEINKAAEQLQDSPDELTTNDLLQIIAANTHITNRLLSNTLHLQALIANKEAEADVVARKYITLTTGVTTAANVD